MINSLDDFVKANGEMQKIPVKMKTNKGGIMEYNVVALGAEGRDRLQTVKVKMLEFEAYTHGKAILKEDITNLRGTSNICVALGIVNDENEHYMDNEKGIKFLDESVIPSELDRIADIIMVASGLGVQAEIEAKKK